MPYVLADALARCRDPFPGDKPFGEDAKYESSFLDLRAEMQKLTAQSSSEGGINWQNARSWSLEILGGKSKDLTVAGYLSLALFMTEGYGGLADGLEIFAAFVRDHWNGIFPSRPKGRGLAIEWLASRVAPLVESRAPREAERPILAPLKELLVALQDQVREKCEPPAPSLGELIQAVGGHLSSFQAETPTSAGPEAEPTPAAAAAAAAEAPVAAPAPSAPPASTAPRPGAAAVPLPDAPTAAPTSANEVRDRIRPLLPAFRQLEPQSPTPYRILRALKWDSIAIAPAGAPDTGRTLVPPPRAHQRNALEALAGAGKWADLLTASEGAFAEGSGTFWLDLQRYTALALENLVGPASKPVAVVKDETRLLLAAWPDLPKLGFADGTPFATETTRSWLASLSAGGAAEEAPSVPVALPARRADAAGSGSAAGSESALGPDDIREAQEHFAKKRFPLAIDALQRGIERAVSTRSKFRTRLAAGRICLQAGQPDWARPLLEDLHHEMESLTFEKWEPELSVELYQYLAVCYGRLAKERKGDEREDSREALEKIKSRLFRLDMRAAAAIDEMIRR